MTRQSNIELLRILAMLFIALHHFCLHGGICPDFFNQTISLGKNTIAMSLTEAVVYTGVNCFILISGYCGIRLSLRKVANLYLVCVFYGLLSYIIQTVYSAQVFCTTDMLNASLFCFSKDSWWFMNCYAVLMLLSPLLNRGLERMSQRQLGWLIACWTVAQIYLGYFRHAAYFDKDNGYNVLNFIYLYLIGGYMRYHLSKADIRSHRLTWLVIYIAGTLVWAGCSCWAHIQYSPWWHINAYNNPLIITNAAMLFLLVLSFDFHSLSINRMAAGVLGVYLLQDHWIKGQTPFCYTMFRDWFEASSAGMQYMAAVIASIVLLLVVCLFDRLRAFVFQFILKRIPDNTI